MQCLAIMCLYVIGAMGTPTSPTDAAAVRQHHDHVHVQSTGDLQGKAGVGIMHRSGIYLEINHHSNILDPHDRGYEHIQLGIVKSIPVWR